MSATTGVADDQYPFCHPAAEVQDQVVLLPLEERGGGWRDIKTASIIRMVEMITTLDYHDSGFIHDLLLTHRDFVSPPDFFDLLIKRNESPPAACTQYQKQQFEKEKSFIRSSTILIVRRWIPNLRPSDFVNYPNLYDKVLGFINSTHDDYHAELFALLYKAKSPPPTKSLPEPKLQSAASTMRIVQRAVSSPPPLARTASILSFHLSPRTLERSASTVFYSQDTEAPPSPTQYSPDQIAQELTLLDQEYFSAIHAHEFVGQAWSSSPADAPNIVTFTRWFNRLSNWMVTKIVSKESPEQRAAVIEGFVAIAMNFLELKNYSGLMGVFSSLHNAAISRLKTTWHIVSAKSKADLELLEFLLSPAKNFKNYRKILQEVEEHPEPCIPVVGIFLTDTTFMYENPPKINGLVNIERVFLLGEKIKQFLVFQKLQYSNLRSAETLRESILSERICDENECFNLSKLREESSTTPPQPSNKRRSGHTPSKLRMMDLSNDELMESASSTLSERDWQILLTGAKELRFPAGHIIFDEGEKVSYIYKVVSGKVRRRTSNSGLLSGLASKNQTFGDTAFINSGLSMYRAVAEKDTVLLAMGVAFISNLFETDYDLAATFYKTTSVRFARMYNSGVKALDAVNPLSLSSEDSFSKLNIEDEEESKSASDIEYCMKFGLPEDEVVIKSYSCKHSSVSGLVYISQHFVCFYGSVFGLSKQKAFPFTDITRVEKVEKSLVLNKVNSKKAVQKFTFKSIQELREAYQLVQSIWKTTSMSSSDDSSRPGSPPLRAPNKTVLPTKEEWETLLKGAKLQTFKKGDTIVPEGQELRKLYQVFQGICTVEKSIANSTREIVNVIKVNDLFGELGFVLGGQSKVSLVAQTDVEMYLLFPFSFFFLFSPPAFFLFFFSVYFATLTVNIYVLEISFVHALLNLRPMLTPKFYRYVAVAILKRLLSFRDKTNLFTTKSGSSNNLKPLYL